MSTRPLQDLRYGLRALRKNPAYSLVAIATLAIGIGAGTAVFSIAGAVLLRPLPYGDPGRLVRVFETNPLKNWTRNIASPANYADWKAQNTVFTDIAAYEQFNANGSGASEIFLTGQGEPQGLKSLGVTGNLFSVLGAPPLLGRPFTDDETFEGKARVVILSYGLWQSAFAGDRGIIGRSITLSGRTYDVVGVMPRAFFFPGRDVHLWLPVAYQPSVFVRQRRPHWLGVVARLKPDVSLDRAQQEMDQIARGLEKQYPDTNTQMGIRLERFHDSLAYAPRPALLMLSGAVGLLFLIVCVNIANLQLGRATVRVRELAIRRALGAGRRRLVRQLLTESLIVSAIGGALGFGIAILARAAVQQLAASVIPLFAEIRLDLSVVLFCAALSLVAPLIFARAAGADVVEGRDGWPSGAKWRRATRASCAARSLPPRSRCPSCSSSAPSCWGAACCGWRRSTPASIRSTWSPSPSRCRPPVTPSRRSPACLRGGRAAAAGAAGRPGRRRGQHPRTARLHVDRRRHGRRARRHRLRTRAAPQVGDARTTSRPMGIRLLAGRMLNDGDTIDQPRVTVVNEALAKQYFRGEDAIGRRIKFARPTDDDVLGHGHRRRGRREAGRPRPGRPSRRRIRPSASGCRIRSPSSCARRSTTRTWWRRRAARYRRWIVTSR